MAIDIDAQLLTTQGWKPLGELETALCPTWAAVDQAPRTEELTIDPGASQEAAVFLHSQGLAPALAHDQELYIISARDFPSIKQVGGLSDAVEKSKTYWDRAHHHFPSLKPRAMGRPNPDGMLTLLAAVFSSFSIPGLLSLSTYIEIPKTPKTRHLVSPVLGLAETSGLRTSTFPNFSRIHVPWGTLPIYSTEVLDAVVHVHPALIDAPYMIPITKTSVPWWKAIYFTAGRPWPRKNRRDMPISSPRMGIRSVTRVVCECSAIIGPSTSLAAIRKPGETPILAVIEKAK